MFLRNEKEAFAKLRACLLATFQEVVGSCPVSRIMQETQTQLKFDSSANNSILYVLKTVIYLFI